MAMPTTIQGDVVILGTLYASGMEVPSGAVKGTGFSSSPSERLPASKAEQLHALRVAQANGTDVVARTEMIHVARGAGELVEVGLAVDAVAAGGDKTVTIDVQKSTGGGAFGTLLSAAYVLDSSKTAKTKYNAVLAVDSSYLAGDLLRVVITVAGSTGTQAQGLVVSVFCTEDPA